MMKCTYTYYLYFKDNELYAYTDNKSYAKEFESVRNMDVFVKKKAKLVSSDINILALEYQSRMLTKKSLYTFNENGIGISIKMIMTMVEYISVSNMSTSFVYNLSQLCWTSPLIFNDKYQSMLDILGYTFMNATLSGKFKKFDLFNMKVDQLSFFLDLFSDTLKMNGENDEKSLCDLY